VLPNSVGSYILVSEAPGKLQIHVNGESKEVSEDTSLSDLITRLQLPVQRIAMELNKEVVRRSQWETTILKDGDQLEIVHFVGGGSP
jgi:thiamine biosynthesis protein ThiS